MSFTPTWTVSLIQRETDSNPNLPKPAFRLDFQEAANQRKDALHKDCPILDKLLQLQMEITVTQTIQDPFLFLQWNGFGWSS